MLRYVYANRTAAAPEIKFMTMVLAAMKRNSLALVSNAFGTMFSEVKNTCIAKIFTIFPRISCSYMLAKSPERKTNVTDRKMPRYTEKEKMLLWSFSFRSCLCIIADAKPKSLKRLKKFEICDKIIKK